MELTTEPLSRDAFAPFGDVIEVGAAEQQFDINYGRTVRYHALAHAEVGDGEAILSIFRSQPVADGFFLEVIERHPLGSQAFMPLSGNHYAVVVAPPGEFDPTGLRAFLAAPWQGVNYHRGTWHHYCLSLGAASDFLVVDRNGPGDNCDEISLPAATQLRIEGL
ncbi:MAG: ureidoglycolate lyase [Pseudomonadota bacterium]